MLVIMPDMVVVMQDMSEQRSRRRATPTPRRGGHSRSLRCGCALWPFVCGPARGPETRTGPGEHARGVLGGIMAVSLCTGMSDCRQRLTFD